MQHASSDTAGQPIDQLPLGQVLILYNHLGEVVVRTCSPVSHAHRRSEHEAVLLRKTVDWQEPVA